MEGYCQRWYTIDSKHFCAKAHDTKSLDHLLNKSFNKMLHYDMCNMYSTCDTPNSYFDTTWVIFMQKQDQQSHVPKQQF